MCVPWPATCGKTFVTVLVTVTIIERKLMTFENKIWKIILFGPIYDSEKVMRRKKINKELHEEMGMASLSAS